MTWTETNTVTSCAPTYSVTSFALAGLGQRRIQQHTQSQALRRQGQRQIQQHTQGWAGCIHPSINNVQHREGSTSHHGSDWRHTCCTTTNCPSCFSNSAAFQRTHPKLCNAEDKLKRQPMQPPTLTGMTSAHERVCCQCCKRGSLSAPVPGRVTRHVWDGLAVVDLPLHTNAEGFSRPCRGSGS